MDPFMLYMMMNQQPKSPDAGKSAGGIDFSKLAMLSMMGGNAMGQSAPQSTGGTPNHIGDALSQISRQMMMQRMMNQMGGQKSGGGLMGMGDKGGVGSSSGGSFGTGPTDYGSMVMGM